MNSHVVLDKTKYVVHDLTVISSTKINQKVTQVLRFFGVLPPVPSAQDAKINASLHGANGAAAPGKWNSCTVVAISAKAPVASKLISIVEIIKRDLAKRTKAQADVGNDTEEDHTAGVEEDMGEKTTENASAESAHSLTLYQYSTVTTTRVEVKMKPPKREVSKSTDELGIKTPLQAPASGPKPIEKGKKRMRPSDSSQQSTVRDQSPTKKTKLDHPKEQSEAGAAEAKLATDEAGEDDEFEEMTTPTEIAEAAKDAKVEAKQEKDVLVLTVYLCLAPVLELAEAYGEQVT